MKLRIRSIRTLLVVPFIFSFIIAMGLISTLVYDDSQKALNEVLTELRKTMISLVKNDLDYKLNEAIQLVKLNEDAYSRKILVIKNQTERERYFSGVLQNYPEVVMTYIGLPNGEFYGARRNLDGSLNVVRNNGESKGASEYFAIDENGVGTTFVQSFANFDPRKRPWYITATEKKELSFGPLYNHFVFKEPTLTASLPLYEDDRLVGVLGVDYLMTRLGDTLKNLPVGKNGQIFIVDEKGQLIANTNGEPIFKTEGDKTLNVLAVESSNPVTKAVMSAYSGSSSTPSEVNVEKLNYLYGVDVYKGHGINWRIFTVIERNDFLYAMNHTLNTAYKSVLILTFIFIVISLLLSEQIVRPILRLNKFSKQLSAGIYEEIKVPLYNNEVDELTKSFNEMGRKITDLVDHLEEEVQIRTAQLEENNKILNELSYIDKLSQLPNRRKFDEFISTALDLASRNGRPIGFLMVDIDHFKIFNDTYGHLEGDHCLQVISRVLKRYVKRQTDLVARYGGEEFAIILQETDFEEALSIAEAIRVGVEDLKIPNKNAPREFVTVSIGLAQGTIEPGVKATEVISLADSALYAAKEKGRNEIQAHKM